MALQDRYSPIVEAKLRATSVLANIVGRQYEGTPCAGAVKVPYRAEATVAAYTPSTGLAGTDTATSFRTISIDQDYAVNEIIDGYEASSVPDGLVAERLDSAGYGLGKKADDIILSVLNASSSGTRTNATAAGTSATKITDQIIDTIAEAKAAGVDANHMWVLVSPTSFAGLLKSDLFMYTANLAEVEVGKIGAFAGVPVYETNNSNFTDSFIVGNSDFIHFVNDFAVAPTVRDGMGQYIGSAQVVARMVCGAAVTNKATVFYK